MHITRPEVATKFGDVINTAESTMSNLKVYESKKNLILK